MGKKERNLLNYAYTVNVLQLLLCLVVFALRSFGLYSNIYVACAVNAVELVIWFALGLAFALGLNVARGGRAFAFPLMAVVPITIVTAATCAVWYFVNKGQPSWGEFFFLASAVNFFHKPAMFAASFFNTNAYFIYFGNIALMFLSALFGSLCGLSANRRALRAISNKQHGKASVVEKEELTGEDTKEASHKKEKKKKKKAAKKVKQQEKLDKEIAKHEKNVEKKNVLKANEDPFAPAEPTPVQKSEAAVIEQAKQEAAVADGEGEAEEEQPSLFDFERISLDKK